MEPHVRGSRRSFRKLFATEDTNVEWGVERLRTSPRSKVQEQEDFLKMMGLRMKRSHTDSSETDDYPRKKKFIIPKNIHLRECSVLISGVVCKICGRNFKCITDLNFHDKLRHQKSTDTSSSGIDTDHNEDETELCEMCNYTFTSVFEKKIHMKKIHREKSQKLRLVFKVGPEVIAKLSVKRKHVKCPANNVANQTDSTNINTVATKDIEQESDFLDIDLSTCHSYTGAGDFSYVNITNPTDRDFGHDINISAINDSVTVNSKQNDSEVSKNNVYITTNVLRTSTENLNSNETRSSAPRNTVIKKLVVSNDTTSLDRAIHPLSNNKSNKQCLENNNNSVVNCDTYSINPTINDTTEKQSLPRDIETSRPKESSCNRQLSDNQVSQLNGFEIQANKNTCPVSNSLKTLNVVTQSRHENKLTAPKLGPKRSKPVIEVFEKTSNEEIQEVLRINRAKRRKEDINHESPNRSEREMLHVLDAIRDMLKMEEKGYHLLDPSMIKSHYRRKSSNGNIVKNSETSLQKNTNTVTKSTEQESHKSLAQTDELDSLKENLPEFTYTNISLQELQKYGINYYNDTIEMCSETA